MVMVVKAGKTLGERERERARGARTSTGVEDIEEEAWGYIGMGEGKVNASQ